MNRLKPHTDVRAAVQAALDAIAAENAAIEALRREADDRQGQLAELAAHVRASAVPTAVPALAAAPANGQPEAPPVRPPRRAEPLEWIQLLGDIAPAAVPDEVATPVFERPALPNGAAAEPPNEDYGPDGRVVWRDAGAVEPATEPRTEVALEACTVDGSDDTPLLGVDQGVSDQELRGTAIAKLLAGVNEDALESLRNDLECDGIETIGDLVECLREGMTLMREDGPARWIVAFDAEAEHLRAALRGFFGASGFAADNLTADGLPRAWLSSADEGELDLRDDEAPVETTPATEARDQTPAPPKRDPIAHGSGLNQRIEAALEWALQPHTARWHKLPETVDDNALSQMVSDVFGGETGRINGELGVAVAGGARSGPRLWLSVTARASRKAPALAGRELVEQARRILGIARPGEGCAADGPGKNPARVRPPDDGWTVATLFGAAEFILGRDKPDMQALSKVVVCAGCSTVRAAAVQKCPGCKSESFKNYHTELARVEMAARKSAEREPPKARKAAKR